MIGKTAGLAGAGIVLALMAGCGSTSTAKGGSSTSNPPAQGKVTSSPSPTASASIAHSEDVKITSCKAGALGGPSATVVVTNHSSKPSNYIIEISFESADGKTQYGTGNAAVNSLNPGQSSAPQTADALTTTPAPAGFACRLSQLTRYAA